MGVALRWCAHCTKVVDNTDMYGITIMARMSGKFDIFKSGLDSAPCRQAKPMGAQLLGRVQNGTSDTSVQACSKGKTVGVMSKPGNLVG